MADAADLAGKGTASEGGVAAQHLKRSLVVLAAPSVAQTFSSVALVPRPIACWRLDDLRFEFDSSFIRPDATTEFADLGSLWNSMGRGPLTLFGHADPVGKDDYNKALSGRRARALYAALIRDPKIWNELFSSAHGGDKWGMRHFQLMLAALGFDPGPIDGKDGPLTQAAVRQFQESELATEQAVDADDTEAVPPEPASPLAATGSVDTPTRTALFRAYMNQLSRKADGSPLVLRPAHFLAKAQDPKLVGDVQGCSEFNPLLILSKDLDKELSKPARQAERNAVNATNRRVVAFLFEKGTTFNPASWPCPPASEGVAVCKKQFWPDGDARRQPTDEVRQHSKLKETMACRFYDGFARFSPCEGTRQSITIFLLDENGQRVKAGTQYRFRCGPHDRRGQTLPLNDGTEDGVLIESGVLAGPVAVIDWATFPLEEAKPPPPPPPKTALERAMQDVPETEPFAETLGRSHKLEPVAEPAEFRFHGVVRLDTDDVAAADGKRATLFRLKNLNYALRPSLLENLKDFQTQYGIDPKADLEQRLGEVNRSGTPRPAQKEKAQHPHPADEESARGFYD
jgi:hypothetical protein